MTSRQKATGSWTTSQSKWFWENVIGIVVYFVCFFLSFFGLNTSIRKQLCPNEPTPTTEEIHVKLKQQAIKHAADSGGLTQALSGKCCRVQIFWHCCRQGINQPEEETPRHRSASPVDDWIPYLGNALQTAWELFNSQLLSQFLPINQALIHSTLCAPLCICASKKNKSFGRVDSGGGEQAGKAHLSVVGIQMVVNTFTWHHFYKLENKDGFGRYWSCKYQVMSNKARAFII